MSSSLLLLFTIIILALGYLIYGRFLKRVFGVDPHRATPAFEKRDGVDFEPAKNWLVLFGHHFSSISGAGPIVGPVVACAYWGWGPSVLWLLIGAIWMGGVADFAALFISVRSNGDSISNISKPEISPRARIFFMIFVWLALVLVVSVFAIFAAKTLVKEPTAVIPSFGLIPVALFFGWLLYQKNVRNRIATPIGLILIAGLLFLGTKIPIVLSSFGGFSPETIWIVALLIYCFFASITPVQTLLQPRDYLASFILFAIVGIGVASVFITNPTMSRESFHAFNPSDWPAAGPLWPMLFVTIACGAISGFHSMVSSGTSCKQISTEGHVGRVGYGGMLLECLLGVLVLICVCAALSTQELGALLRNGGPIEAFSAGFGNLSKSMLGGYGKSFAVLALNAFILTTLDTATRITRYLTTELFGISNKYLSTAIVVGTCALLALTGQWAVLWPAFGASNQLIAGISLLVASCWLLHRGKGILITLIPAIIMLAVTMGAFIYQFFTEITKAKPDWIIIFLCVGLAASAIFIFIEAFKVIQSKKNSVSTAKN
jgi:carbon starvation protein